ncbi:hypothetical protein ACI65C_009711, partial [Semiaphis heraclei]
MCVTVKSNHSENETEFKEKVRSKMENQNDHQINQNDQNHHDEPDKNNDQSIKDYIASNNDHQIDQNDQNHHDEPDKNNDQSIKDDIAIWKDMAKTPKEFCTSSIIINTVVSKFFKCNITHLFIIINYYNSKLNHYTNFTYLNGSHEVYYSHKGGKKYKYDENNGYKCFLTSMEIGLNDELQKDMDMINTMEEKVREYILYHLEKFEMVNE